MDVHSIISFVTAHKEDLLAIVGSVVTTFSLVLHLLPTPGDKSSAVYKFIYRVIHVIALNKKIPAKA